MEEPAMTFCVYPVTPEFAAEIGDLDLSKPIADDDFQRLSDLFDRYSVLVFPDQRLDQDQHLDFARRFGPLETTIGKLRKDAPIRLHEQIADVSNLSHNGGIWGETSRLRLYQLGNRLWHTDSSFKRVPARASLLYAHSIAPVGGHTEFADMRAAWDALPEEMKRRLDGRVAEHAIMYSRAKLGFSNFSKEEIENLPPVPQAMVRTHAGSKRRSLYIASHVGKVYGMPDDEATALLEELTAHATQRQFVYTHRWRVNDLVLWDNRCTMHRGTEFDDLRWKRDVRRATVSDEIPSCEREGIAVPASIAAE
ncbi:MAG: TauD/TfdA family dioxygenase [Rhodospirillales bacterium]|nr:MAG: TauD/TfdA family dioxygenase [Rhodospirillales bacterium]